MHSRNMSAQSIFGLECLLAMVTIVVEVTREVNTLNMVPDIDLLREALKNSIFKDFIERKGGGSHGIKIYLSKNYLFNKLASSKLR